MALPSRGSFLGQYVVYNGYNYQWTGAAWVNRGQVSVTANTIVANTITTGNTTVNTAITSNGVSTGNSTVNTAVSANGVSTGNSTVNTSISANGVVTGNTAVTSNGISTGNSTVNTAVSANGISTGNSTVNTAVSANGISTGNSTVNTAVSANGVVTGNTAVSANGVSTGNTTVNTAVSANGVITGNSTVNTAVSANGISTGNSTTNTTITSNSISVGNSTVNVTINSTSFAGTANNTLYVGSVSAANVVSNAQLSGNLSNYQTTAGLSANVSTLSSNNSTYLNGQLASYYTNASNITTGTLDAARLPATSNVSTAINVGSNVNINTSSINVGSLSIKANSIVIPANASIDFSTSTYKPDFLKGRMYWDNEEQTIVVYGDGSSFEQTMGQREWVRAHNSTASTITKGTPVYITGVHIPGDPVHGHHPTIAPGDASDYTKSQIIGLAGEDILASAHGYVVVRGYIEGLNTSALTSGQRAHLGFATPGTIVLSAPEYPNYPTDLGMCLTSDATDGTFYVDLAMHTAERFRTTQDMYVGGDLSVSGNLNITGSVTTTNATNLSVGDNILYIGTGDTISSGATIFTGSGLNDMLFHGVFEGTSSIHYYVKIDSTGTTDTFAWSKDNFSTTVASGVAITGNYQTLDNGIKIQFNATTGHTLNNKWDGTAAPVNVDLGWVGNYNDGTYHHTGIFRDASDGVYKFFQGYTPEPDAAVNIDTSHASFQFASVQANVFTGNLLGTANNANNLGGISLTSLQSQITGNAATAYSNSVSYTDSKIGTANSAISANSTTAYTNAVSYTDGKILTANSAITGNAATAYTNAVSYTDGKILTANGAITGNAATAYTNAVSYTDGKIATANTAMAANAATAYSNAVSYTDTKIGTANTAITGNAATAYTNAVSYTDGKIATANTAMAANAATAYTNAISTFSSTIGANIASYLPTYTGTVNSAAVKVESVFNVNSTQANISSIPLSANGANGTAGWVLTSNGNVGSPYWAVAAAVGGSTNVDSQYAWTNTQSFSNTITFNGLLSANTVNAISFTAGANITANSTQLKIFGTTTLSVNNGVGTAGQVLISNGSGGAPYWGSSSGVYVRQQYTGDGTTTTFTVTGGYSPSNLAVFLNGVMLRNGIEVTVTSGTVFVCAVAPPNGSYIDVMGQITAVQNGITIGRAIILTSIFGG